MSPCPGHTPGQTESVRWDPRAYMSGPENRVRTMVLVRDAESSVLIVVVLNLGCTLESHEEL